MRAPAQYVALRDLQLPGSYAFAARAGDDVTEAQRQTMGLAVGLDIMATGASAMERPADDAERREWQDYAVVRGVPYAEAVNLDAKDLKQAVADADADAARSAPDTPPTAGGMPVEGDLKAHWVDYAASEIVRYGRGQVDQETALDWATGLTKPQLIETFGPGTPETRQAFVDERLPQSAAEGQPNADH